MSVHINAVAQRRVNGHWLNLLDCPVSPIRLDWYTKVHYAFLANGDKWPDQTDIDFTISLARGYPDDYNPYNGGVVHFYDPVIQDDVKCVDLPDELALDKSWLTLDELINHDYDRVVTRFGESKPLREFLGNQFIDFWKEIKAMGAERIVFGFD